MEDIKQEFDKEFRIINGQDLPFKKIFATNENFKLALFKEFATLTPRPKLSLFIEKDVSAEQWEKAVTVSGHPVMADYVPYTGAELSVMALKDEFYELDRTGKLDNKYYGRFIKDTNTAQTLREVRKYIGDFEGYVFEPNTNAGEYSVYARAFCDNIIHLLNQLNIPGLKDALLTHFINEQNPLFFIEFIVTKSENKEAQKKYDILKTYAAAIFRKEIKPQAYNQPPPTAAKPTETEITQVQYALYYYYLQKTGDKPHFENHPGGKLKAIKELILPELEKYGLKSPKNFQSAYNSISISKTNRIAVNQIENIKVAISLLDEYPNAQQLAKDELKTAEAKR